MIGYRNGLALTILVGRLPKLFGFSVEVHGCFGRVMAFVHGVATGETVPAALAIGMSCGVPECAHADQWRSMVSSGHA